MVGERCRAVRRTVRRTALVAHVASVGWAGAVAAFLVPVITAVGAPGEALWLGGLPAATLVAWWVVPAAVASLVTGVVSSVLSGWGRVRHYWVAVKLAPTVLATGVLLLRLPSIDALAPPVAGQARAFAVVHAIGGLVVLLGAPVLGVVKPRGFTRCGIRLAGSG